jgi:hypothetical protein
MSRFFLHGHQLHHSPAGIHFIKPSRMFFSSSAFANLLKKTTLPSRLIITSRGKLLILYVTTILELRPTRTGYGSLNFRMSDSTLPLWSIGLMDRIWMRSGE